MSLKQETPGTLMFVSVVHRPSSERYWGRNCWPASHSTEIWGSHRGDALCNEKWRRNGEYRLNGDLLDELGISDDRAGKRFFVIKLNLTSFLIFCQNTIFFVDTNYQPLNDTVSQCQSMQDWWLWKLCRNINWAQLSTFQSFFIMLFIKYVKNATISHPIFIFEILKHVDCVKSINRSVCIFIASFRINWIQNKSYAASAYTRNIEIFQKHFVNSVFPENLNCEKPQNFLAGRIKGNWKKKAFSSYFCLHKSIKHTWIFKWFKRFTNDSLDARISQSNVCGIKL